MSSREPEVQLTGGTANRGLVVRVGDTVRRPWRPTGPATHALLDHLADVGFDGSPRFLGADEQGREVLTFLPGQAITPPYPPWALTDEALVDVARLLRRFHDAVADFDPGPHTWPPSPPGRFRTGPVSHNDPNLDNVIFRDRRAVGLIDFDLASPGSPVWDVAAAARLWGPMRPDADIPDARRGRALHRLRTFVDAYGLAGSDRGAVVDALEPNLDWCYDIVQTGADTGVGGFGDYWTSAVSARVDRTRRWYRDSDQQLRAALHADS